MTTASVSTVPSDRKIESLGSSYCNATGIDRQEYRTHKGLKFTIGKTLLVFALPGGLFAFRLADEHKPLADEFASGF